MKRLLFILVMISMASCHDEPEQTTAGHLADPTELNAVQTDLTTVRLTWKDNADGEKGYRVFLREENSYANVPPVATLDADASSYDFAGLTPGELYDFGVQAISEDFNLHSEAVYVNDVEVVDYPKIPVITDVRTSYAYIAVSYKVDKLSDGKPEHGICFSETGTPSVDDIKVLGPDISEGAEVLQVVPNAYLESGKEYMMSVFVKNGERFAYSQPMKVKLENQPDEISLAWERQTCDGLPSEVGIYRTSSQISGRNFNAWYAVADPAKVDFRVLNTPTGRSNLKTVAWQAENADRECLVLINGGIFGNYHIGVIHTDGQPQEWVDFVYDRYWNPNGNGTSWPITRPVIGVDKAGKAGAYWTASPQFGTYHYYHRPLPTVPGEAEYPEAGPDFPVAETGWEPYNAISTGPMLLYDGKCCIDHEKAPSGAYLTNYECWALDIYEGRPDRTAVGVTSDGKIVLFVCDGRIDASQGATLEEVAMVMKSIGCVHAMNLDGGGSTGMWVKGSGMINHKDGDEWRAVKSTLGFFSK